MTFWDKTFWIDRFINNAIASAHKSDLSRFIPGLSAEILLQKKVYRLLKFYHRKKTKEKFEQVCEYLFSNPEYKDFQAKIFEIFR